MKVAKRRRRLQQPSYGHGLAMGSTSAILGSRLAAAGNTSARLEGDATAPTIFMLLTTDRRHRQRPVLSLN